MECLKFTDEVRRAVGEVLGELLRTENNKTDAECAERYVNLVEATLADNVCCAKEHGGSELVVVESMVKTIFHGTRKALRSILLKWLWAYKRAEQKTMERIQKGCLSGSPVTSAWFTEGFTAACWVSEFAWCRRYLHFREFYAEMDRIYTETNSVERVAQELDLPTDAAEVMLRNQGCFVSEEPLPKLNSDTLHSVSVALAAWSLGNFPEIYDEEDDWYVD